MEGRDHKRSIRVVLYNVWGAGRLSIKLENGGTATAWEDHGCQGAGRDTRKGA